MTAAALTSAPPRPRVPALMAHQKVAADFIVSHPYAGVWMDVGTGKTLATLAALSSIRPAGHILVIAPVAIARSVWIDEIADHGLPIRTRSLICDENDRRLSKAKRLERFQEVFTDPPTMYFLSQELVSRPPLRSCPVCHGAGGPGKRPCLTCQTGLVDQMPVETVNGRDVTRWPFPTVVIDESQGFKSHSSRRFKALMRVRPAIGRLIELSGTPAPNGLEDLWSQAALLDEGRALGRTITAYRTRWFTPHTIPGTTIPARWRPNPGASDQIHAAVAPIAMSAVNTHLHLPPVSVVDERVSLPPDLMRAYEKFRRDLVLDLVAAEPDGSRRPVAEIVAANQAVLQSKLLQFASGTLYTDDPDDPSTKGRFEGIHEAKLAMVSYLVRNTGGSPVLLAHHFRSDRVRLLDRLRAEGVAAEAFDGSRDMVSRWNIGQIPVMLIHPASGGPGLNLQHGGHTLIWYTLPFSLEHYQQLNGRLHRPGQTDPVQIHRILARGTIDDRMPAVLSGKRATQQALLDAVDAELTTAITGITTDKESS